ncbi:helix-turn-helix domain-containing protein [Microcella sp.]|uniref:helix-turn-helix domain-containing protein n=1 Tax=Microcella sp. TaxID=1913979 RepID=UPI00391BCBF7
MSTATNVTPLRGRIPEWTFAERARKVRRDMGLTQEQMSDQLEVGLKAYSAWESGKNSPENIAAIAVRFEEVSGVPRTWFLGWADSPPSGGGTNLFGERGLRLGHLKLVGPEGLEPPASSV